MKFLFPILIMVSFSVKASPHLTIKERLRLHLWSYGMEDKSVKKVKHQRDLPEEIERALKKF